MKFIPILFSTETVQDILDGRKTQTRRVVKSNGVIHTARKIVFEDENWQGESGRKIKCPYGQPGDVLWVREAFIEGFQMSEGSYKYDDEGNLIPKIWHKADNGLRQWYDGTSDWPTENIPWKPSIHMPKYACRIFLKVKSVRVERLQKISEKDAKAEGVLEYDDGTFKNYFKTKGLRAMDGVECLLSKGSFQSLWSSINGLDSWNSNPWVWVIEFEQIEKPENFC